ncbi:MAG: hypothetical protein ACSHWS_10975 [Sulfitobacter sp.]
MRTEKYNRLVRSLAASVLQSDLTDKELKELLEMLQNGRLNRDLENVLEGFVWKIPSYEHSKNHFADDFTEDVLETRVSKTLLHNVISSLLGEDAPNKSKTMRDMIIAFEMQASSNQKKKLLDILRSNVEGDAFLRGISDRHK